MEGPISNDIHLYSFSHILKSHSAHILTFKLNKTPYIFIFAVFFPLSTFIRVNVANKHDA